MASLMNREQECAVERLALAHGRVCVRDGFADHHVDATVPSGQCWRITEDGLPIEQSVNFSIDWTV